MRKDGIKKTATLLRFCAHDWSRTSTSLRTLPPQGSVSTNSTTWAGFSTTIVLGNR